MNLIELNRALGQLRLGGIAAEINVSIRATHEIEEGLYTHTCFEQFNHLLDTEPGLLTG